MKKWWLTQDQYNQNRKKDFYVFIRIGKNGKTEYQSEYWYFFYEIMPEESRLQVRKNTIEGPWKDVGHRLTDLSIPTKEKDVAPTDSFKNNPSYSLTYSSGKLTKIEMTIGSTAYEKILTYSGNTLTDISVWSEV